MKTQILIDKSQTFLDHVLLFYKFLLFKFETEKKTDSRFFTFTVKKSYGKKQYLWGVDLHVWMPGERERGGGGGRSYWLVANFLKAPDGKACTVFVVKSRYSETCWLSWDIGNDISRRTNGHTHACAHTSMFFGICLCGWAWQNNSKEFKGLLKLL